MEVRQEVVQACCHGNSRRGKKMKVGFIGTGVMGSRMIKQFLQQHTVLIYNRSPEKTKELVELGAERLDSVAAVAQMADIICTCLSMPGDVIGVYEGEKGILAHARPGAICIDFTTVGAETSRELFAEAAKQKIDYLDAPVSGGPEGVEQGTLTIMVGGKEAAFQTVEPLLALIGAKVEFLGTSGSGSVAKLINQYLVGVHSLAAAEAMVTGAALGLDSEQLYHILKVSYGNSRMLERHMEQYVLPGNFEPGGALKYLHKDVKLANKLVEAAGLDQSTGALAESVLSEAINEGLGDFDMASVIKLLEKKGQVEVKREK
ncbi:NAD(P)-dependent oxidoreductase [Halalkalibacter oceani]|uniref:NAD(P)-dependent oxidoreductase n=1 Tax=Halalkalibacter oceani TaxID=1653776 RepID=UPI0033944191